MSRGSLVEEWLQGKRWVQGKPPAPGECILRCGSDGSSQSASANRVFVLETTWESLCSYAYLTAPKPMVLKVRSPDQQYQLHQGSCYRCKLLLLTPYLLSQKLWGRRQQSGLSHALQVILRHVQVCPKRCRGQVSHVYCYRWGFLFVFWLSAWRAGS